MPDRAVIAAVQATPVFLDREATTDKACGLIKEAATAGAHLVAFPEAFIPTFPDWVLRLPPWQGSELTTRLRAAAVAVPSPTTDRLAEAAAEAGVYVVIGVNEIDGATLYNSLLYFGPDGALVNRHRKLMPTGGERTIWGMGDGSTLEAVRTPFGVVGGLICWENYMPLARAAMYAHGIDIHIAPTWDNGETWLATLRHIAKEGRCYVVGVSAVQRGSDVPEGLRGTTYGGDDDWMSSGWSAIVAPGGDVVAGPLKEVPGILYAEVDHDVIAQHRNQFDPVGHYARPDVFRLQVNTSRQTSVEFGKLTAAQ